MLTLTIVCDLMQSLFHHILRGGQYKPRTTPALMFATLRSKPVAMF